MSTITVQLTAMSLVAEDTPSAWFETTRIDSGIYGDSTDAAPGLPNELVADNGLWVRYGPHKLYEGWLQPPQQTWTNDERWYVPASSYLARGKRNETFGRIYKDSDIAQWQGMENVPSWASALNSGDKWRVLNTAGNPVPTADYNAVYPVAFYWLGTGLISDQHIDSLTFGLTKVGTVDAGLTLGVLSWAVPPIPGASYTSEATYTSATTNGSKTVTLTGSDKIAVGLYVKSTDSDGWTATADNGFDIEDLVVTTSAGITNVGEALADLAKVVGIDAGNALHTYSDTSVSSLVARPMTTVAAAQESIVALAASQLVWGYTPGGWFDSEAAAAPDPTNKEDRARWWSLSHADCTFTSDVIEDGEGFYDYVTVLYAAIGVSGVTDGTLRSVTRQPGGSAGSPSATARVKLLDYSSRYMTTAEAQAVGDQWLLWQGPTTGARGTQNITGDVRDVDGHVRPALFIQPGDWVDERDRRGHVPWLVTGVSYAATGAVAVSVGGAERQWNGNPGVAGIYTDAPLGTGEPTADASSDGSGSSSYADWLDDWNRNHPWNNQLTKDQVDYIKTHPGIGGTWYQDETGGWHNTLTHDPNEAT